MVATSVGGTEASAGSLYSVAHPIRRNESNAVVRAIRMFDILRIAMNGLVEVMWILGESKAGAWLSPLKAPNV